MTITVLDIFPPKLKKPNGGLRDWRLNDVSDEG